MRVAIVNDVPLIAEALKLIVRSVPQHRLAWVAGDGEQAVRHCLEDRPDVVLMDLVMPVMNGVEATRRIMRETPCPILVVTSAIGGNFTLVCEAMGYGAVDAVQTPILKPGTSPQQAGAALLAKMDEIERRQETRQMLGRATSLPHADAPLMRQPTAAAPTASATRAELFAPSLPPLLVIGASTGGPQALSVVLAELPANFSAAVVILQHIDAAFATGLATYLQGFTKLPLRLAKEGEIPRAGIVLIANTDGHVRVSDDLQLGYSHEPFNNPYHPSADVFFHSLAAHWPVPGVAVLLTGLGRDGAEGMLALRQRGWYTIAQDQATSVVYGMPRAAAELGAARIILPLQEVAAILAQRFPSATRPV